MSGYCLQCSRTVYLVKGETPACPVCAYPLSEQGPEAESSTDVA